MLDHVALKKILDKDILADKDFLDLNDHLGYIGAIKDANETLPKDVFDAFNNDSIAIADRMKEEHKNLLKRFPQLAKSKLAKAIDEITGEKETVKKHLTLIK